MSRRRSHPLRIVRIVLASVMFVGLVWLFLDSTGLTTKYLSWMADLQFIPAWLNAISTLSLSALAVVLVTIALTFIYGRVYCSVVCPLGILQDLFIWLGGRRWWRRWVKPLGRRRWNLRPNRVWLRATMVVLFLVLLIPLHPIASLIEPYSIFGRIMRMWSLPTVMTVLTGLFVGFLAVWSMRDGRMWCNTFCPVGALLGLMSRFSIRQLTIDTDKCEGCGTCGTKCKAHCIDMANHTVDASRCVDCFDCMNVCPGHAFSFQKPWSKKDTRPVDTGKSVIDMGVDSSRRQFMAMTGALAVAAAASAQSRVDGGLAVIEDKQVPPRQVPVKPAGSVALKDFTLICTSCQLCVTVCPEHVLQPSTKLETLLQPELHYENGYCVLGCTRCADICPTGAITRITKEEKSSLQIGHAVWIKENCIVETQGEKCGNCARHCPTGAIQMVPNAQGRMIPAIDTERCIGCGHCEYVCPSRPFSAIYVEGHEQHRMI